MTLNDLKTQFHFGQLFDIIIHLLPDGFVHTRWLAHVLIRPIAIDNVYGIM